MTSLLFRKLIRCNWWSQLSLSFKFTSWGFRTCFQTRILTPPKAGESAF